MWLIISWFSSSSCSSCSIRFCSTEIWLWGHRGHSEGQEVTHSCGKPVLALAP